MSPHEYFDRAYVVNLVERTDRRREMIRMLERTGLGTNPAWLEFFPAVKPDSAGPFPSRGARGCFLSHLGILKQARSAGFRRILILEDDLEIDPAFLTQFPALSQILDETGWMFAYFGHVLDSIPGPSMAPMRPVDPSREIQTTHFYAVNGPWIPPLIDFLEALLTRQPGDPAGGPMHVDGAYSTFRARHPDGPVLAAGPNLGWQRSSRSDITSRWFDRLPILREVAGAARQLKATILPSRRPPGSGPGSGSVPGTK